MIIRRRKALGSSAVGSCTSAGRVTARLLLLSLLSLSGQATNAYGVAKVDEQAVLPFDPAPVNPPATGPPSPAEHTFTLRHIFHHGAHRHPRLHRRLDVVGAEADVWLAAEDDYEAYAVPALKAKSHAVKIERLADRRPSAVDPIVALGRERGYATVLASEAWSLDDVSGPDISDKETVLSLALMAANAYVQMPGQPDWEEVGDPFNRSADFGWESDGLRGHVWADDTNSTVVMGLKGTSPAVFDGDGTTTNDKVNDNLFFSCCCAQQGPWTWHQVCDCASGSYQCNNTCVVGALREENRYYAAVRELYSNVTELFPDSEIWVTGHSLGGAVSSMLGLTYGLPVVTFQAVPEALAAGRLGLPVPPGADSSRFQTRELTGTYHFGHTADPIYIGTCNGATASCSFGGYALETACHTGYECIYDTVGDKGWRVGIGTHKIRTVIHDVLMKYDSVPECKFKADCRDCSSWNMFESNGTESTTTSKSSTSSKTRTRTATCQTPGWWGCLDETTTTTATTTTSTTTTTTTTTCKTPGWFGCKDKTTTTETTTTTTTIPISTTSTTTSTTTTCLTPGKFWGCNDKTTTAAPSTSPSHPITTPPTPPASSGTPTSTVTSTATTTATETPAKKKCLHRNWIGFCKEWGNDCDEQVDEL